MLAEDDALSPDLRGIDMATLEEWAQLHETVPDIVPESTELVMLKDLPRIIARAIATDRNRRRTVGFAR